MIPHVIHRIWLGADRLPERFEEYGESWRRNHPGWEMRLWTDEDVSDLSDPKALARARSAAERSDLLRYELLHRFGGVYVDTDVECLRSIEPLIDGAPAFAGREPRGLIGNAVLGAIPGHLAFEAAAKEARTRIGYGTILKATGPPFLDGVLARFPELVVFPPEVFYSPVRDDVGWEPPPGAYALHHWTNSWLTREELVARVGHYQAKARRLERDRGRTEARLEKTAARLSSIERSRWWRLGLRLAALSRRRRG